MFYQLGKFASSYKTLFHPILRGCISESIKFQLQMLWCGFAPHSFLFGTKLLMRYTQDINVDIQTVSCSGCSPYRECQSVYAVHISICATYRISHRDFYYIPLFSTRYRHSFGTGTALMITLQSSNLLPNNH